MRSILEFVGIFSQILVIVIGLPLNGILCSMGISLTTKMNVNERWYEYKVRHSTWCGIITLTLIGVALCLYLI